MALLNPQLEAFIAIAKYKTVHAAAETLFVTQTAVTQRIKALEAKLRVTLFIRSRRGMILTKEGESLLRYCHTVKLLEGEVLAQIQGASIQSEVQLSITAPTSIMRSRILPDCLSAIKKFPQLLFYFDVRDAENRHQMLRRGECDFAVIDEKDIAQEFKYKKLKPEEYVLVCSSQWKNRKLADILKKERIVDFNPQDQMTFEYLKAFNLFEGINHSRHFVNRTDDLAMMVANGAGYTTMTKEFAKQYVQTKELMILNQGKVFRVTPVLAWYDRPEPLAYFSAIIDAIK